MATQAGRDLIATERQRQIEAEGWLTTHDDNQGADVLALAALSYRDAPGEDTAQPEQWPWGAEFWKPKSRQRNLVRAGALYLAAAGVAERANNYAMRDIFNDQVGSCVILLDSILATQAANQCT